MFKTLPAAEKHREEAAKADNDGEYDNDDLYGSDEADDWVEEEQQKSQAWGAVNASEVPDTKGDVKDESQAYLDFLSEEAKKFGALADDDDDSMIDEDNFFESPLDRFDPYGTFRQSMGALHQTQPQLYEQLISVLEQADRDFLQRVLQPPPMQQ